MNKITLLDQITIDKIAAGEVVERPSSVVKELVENAIDAGSSAITVEIKDGGKSLVRITDNGSGIEKEQIQLAFCRHATSKIKKVEDLEGIASLGFRGEALSSISAVAQVEVITRTAESMAGIRYVIEGGKEKLLEEIGAPEGTTFLVRNLFYNVPARSKFMKTATTEGGYISTLMEQLALSHPEISFKYMVNNQVKLHTTGNGSQKEVIYQVYGRDITKELLQVDFENDYMEVHGYIGKPTVSRGNRNYENYYVNGRYVKNKILTRAIEDAYKGFMMQHKFPFVSLQITMTGNFLDVNVHPTKMEVRFSREQEIYHALYRVLSDCLYQKELIPEVIFEKSKPEPKVPVERKSVPEPFEKSRLSPKPERSWEIPQEIPRERMPQEEKLKEVKIKEVKPQEEKQLPPLYKEVLTSSAGQLAETPGKEYGIAPKPTLTKQESKKEPKQEIPDPPAEKKEPEVVQQSFLDLPLLSSQARSMHRLIGQVFDTYWLVQYQESFYIIDQHAAHEKVLYERLVAKLEKGNIPCQYISPPLIVSLTMEEQNLFMEHKNLFLDFGFEIEEFGGKEYSIRGVPADLYGVSGEELFLEILGSMEREDGKTPEILLHKMATAACKAAVKGNQALSFQEADSLIDELLKLENPYHCPHGRPTIISMTKTELEKKFKRIV